MKWIAIIVSVLFLSPITSARAAGWLDWSGPALLGAGEEEVWPDVGAFVGRHEGALIVAGGAASAGAPSSERIAVFVQAGAAGWQMREDAAWRLPAPVAFGAAVNTAEGLVLAGGTDGPTPSRSVLRLGWDPEKQELKKA